MHQIGACSRNRETRFISVTKLVEQSQEIESAKALAKRLFIESIYDLKGIMKDIQEGREANARKTRRSVQGLIDLMGDHEMYMIGLLLGD